MRVLLDECLPRRLRREFPGHTALTTADVGWAGLSNGTLLRRAAESFDAFITVDRNLSFQQNHRDLRIAVVVLVARSNAFETLRLLIPEVLRVLPLLHKGQVVRVGPA